MKINKNFIISASVVITIIGGIVFLAGGKNNARKESSLGSNLYKVDSITHAHGLTVDVADSNKLYIATHHGVFVLINDKDLYQVGKSNDDYMGFSPHGNNPKVFFGSGHPETGGNIGVQKSEDGAVTWKTIANGVNGPVDFHAMAVSPVNANFMYGWYDNNLERSSDGGKNWEVVNSNLLTIAKGVGPYHLVADPKDENVIYAASGLGLFTSRDKGSNWKDVSDQLKETAVLAFAISPQDTQKMLSFTPTLHLAKSSDGGKTWQKINETFGTDTIYFIAFDKNNPQTVYILTSKNSIYKSTNGGDSWNKIR